MEAVRVRLRPVREQRLALWQHWCSQRQAYNHAVRVCVDAAQAGSKIPSKYDLHKLLTAARRGGVLPPDGGLCLQRAGAEAGRLAVKQWADARWKLDSKAVYWQIRLTAAETEADGDTKRADLLRAAGCVSASKKTLKGELTHCAAKLDHARSRRDRHLDQGVERLFRSRKRTMGRPEGVQAVVFNDDVTVTDGQIRLPGGLRLDIADRPVTLTDGTVWDPAAGGSLPDGYRVTKAAQIVDTTVRVTRMTRPWHRRWEAHLIVERPDPALPSAERLKTLKRSEVLGCDAGCVTAMTLSDGRKLDLPDETDDNARIKRLQRREATLTNGSRRHKRIARQKRAAYAKRTRRRDNAARQIAADIASTPGVLVVGMEQSTKNMNRSAKGTADHPGHGVARKRALNRKLSDSRFNGIRGYVAAACVKRGKLPAYVAGQHTSQVCSRCWHPHHRESQSSCWCPRCATVRCADRNASHNVGELTWRTVIGGEPVSMSALMASVSAGRGSPSSEERTEGNRPTAPPAQRAGLCPCSSRTRPALPTPGRIGHQPHAVLNLQGTIVNVETTGIGYGDDVARWAASASDITRLAEL